MKEANRVAEALGVFQVEESVPWVSVILIAVAFRYLVSQYLGGD